jgi:hypothetical protein
MILANDYRYEVLRNMRPFFRDVRIQSISKYDDEHYLFNIEHIYKQIHLILDITDSHILTSSFFGVTTIEDVMLT